MLGLDDRQRQHHIFLVQRQHHQPSIALPRFKRHNMAKPQHRQWFSLQLSQEQRQLQYQDCSHVATITHCSAVALLLAIASIAYFQQTVFRSRQSTPMGARDQDQVQLPDHRSIHANQHITRSHTLAQSWQRLQWWLVDKLPLGKANIGRRDEWILGLGWSAWLIFMCVSGQPRDGKSSLLYPAAIGPWLTVLSRLLL